MQRLISMAVAKGIDTCVPLLLGLEASRRIPSPLANAANNVQNFVSAQQKTVFPGVSSEKDGLIGL